MWARNFKTIAGIKLRPGLLYILSNAFVAIPVFWGVFLAVRAGHGNLSAEFLSLSFNRLWWNLTGLDQGLTKVLLTTLPSPFCPSCYFIGHLLGNGNRNCCFFSLRHRPRRRQYRLPQTHRGSRGGDLIERSFSLHRSHRSSLQSPLEREHTACWSERVLFLEP